ncbi:MAG: ATP-dependent DNA helicase RecQ [Acidobacteriota bacterium]
MSSDLRALLKKHWGYSEFRARQEPIVEAILAGRDVAVVMPTGGGKSLCYQLPAVVLQRTAVVVSPLIALMQDQAASMREIGVNAAFLNSTLDYDGARDVRRQAESGALQLLYVSPERIVQENMLDWLKRLPLAFFAIDEAHCISEWGHEFRPEYRQLGVLRQRFPTVPIAAFTASATRVVRHDIVAQLGLRNPLLSVSSFYRPNLRYVVHECAPRQQDSLLDAALDWYREGNVILYAPTIKAVESIAERMRRQGVPIVPYHGRMDAGLRQKNQELWMSGEKRVLVGTLAFGLGINQPATRAVIHLALPKTIEQFYQEAGRAGRDGDAADCVLLWQKRDIGLLTHFVQQLQDSDERERAWQRYHTLRHFVEQSRCRHRQICLHFGETPRWETCGACDVCGVTIEWTAKAYKPVRRMKAAPIAKAAATVAAPVSGADPEDLRERLRAWRREVSKEQAVPAYVIFHDATLDALCRLRPRDVVGLLEVSGIGERKAERFGARILELIALAAT